MATRAPSGGRRRWLSVLGLLMLGLAATALLAWSWSLPARPDAFYDPHGLDPARGGLLRVEAFDRGLPAGASGLRILYGERDAQGMARVASAVVLLPVDAPDGPRPVVAWHHGTTGVAPGCAPPLLRDPFAYAPGLAEALAAGWVVVAPDYPGLGVAGSHPYLIGADTARSVLEAVRAAASIDGVRLAPQVVAWGHSQGGHAALWTGILAASHAPDLELVGVAALAPASDLPALVRAAQGSTVGRILSAYIVHAYAARYPELDAATLVRPGRRAVAGAIARRCLDGARALPTALVAAALPGSLFAEDPGDGPMGLRLAQNVPDRPIAAPVLVAQGDIDPLVLPEVQAGWVARRCAAGQPIEFRRYPGRDHLSLVAADSPLVRDLVDWTQARFAGEPAGPSCGGDAAQGGGVGGPVVD